MKMLDSGDVSDHPYQTQFEAFFNALDKDDEMPLTSLDARDAHARSHLRRGQFGRSPAHKRRALTTVARADAGKRSSPLNVECASHAAFAIGAHPDDIEFYMAGTLLLLKQAGCEIHYMNLASGNCGSVHDGAAEDCDKSANAKRSAPP